MTFGSGGRRSIQLSYRRVTYCCRTKTLTIPPRASTNNLPHVHSTSESVSECVSGSHRLKQLLVQGSKLWDFPTLAIPYPAVFRSFSIALPSRLSCFASALAMAPDGCYLSRTSITPTNAVQSS